MTSIFQAWMDYKKNVMPKEAGASQIEETRIAFYGGAVAVTGLLGQGVEAEAIGAELDRFLAEYKKLKGLQG